MRFRVRNEPDSGPTADGAVVTYSRLSARGRKSLAERQEPFLDAREVPYVDDIRAYDPERAASSGDDAAVDDLAEPRRDGNRGKRRRGGFGAVVVGALALAFGMVILAYAYGIATRVDGPPAMAGASATAPDGAGAIRTTLPAEDAARSVPVTGVEPAVVPADGATATLPPDTASAAPVEPPKPQSRPEQAAREPAADLQPDGSDGVPMDGDFALPATGSGAQPALIAPVPATVPPPAKAAGAPPADRPPVAANPSESKPADSGDDLIANIERLLSRDAANGGAAAQPGDGAAAPAGPTPIVPDQPLVVTDPNALLPLPDPDATLAVTPPAYVGPLRPSRLIPPADIPNLPPTGLGTGLQ